MKNLIFSLKFVSILIISVILFTSCNEKSDVDTPVSGEKEVLLDMGFNEYDIQEFDDYFVVEEDMVFKKENLVKKENVEKPTTSIPEQIELPEVPDLNTIPIETPQLPIEMRQRRSNDWVAGFITDNVRIKIHSSMSSWTYVIQQAINAWNNSGSKIHIDIVSSYPDITIYSDASSSCPSSHRNLPSYVCGRGEFPANGYPGEVISINLDNSGSNTNAKKIYLITHEIGHNIGLAHTNSNDGVYIDGTAINDSYSVMNSGECGSTKALSSNDKIAIKTLYPKCGESMDEWFYSSNFGWLYYSDTGNNWYYMESKGIWIYIDTYENLCSTNIWFYTYDSLCGKSGWLYTDSYGWVFNFNSGWSYWFNC